MHKFMVTVPKTVTNAIHGPPLIADANEVASIRLPSLFPVSREAWRLGCGLQPCRQAHIGPAAKSHPGDKCHHALNAAVAKLP